VKRRVFGAVAAVLLAGVGAALLLTYVGAADERAMAGLETTTVMVVTKPVAQGAAADQISSLVEAKKLPAVAVPVGAVADLTEVTGLVTTTALVPGEQLLSSRFVDPRSLPEAGQVKLGKGLQEVSFALDPQRVVGGHVVAGARVGLFISLPKDEIGPAQTRLALSHVLVSRVGAGSTSAPAVGKTTAVTSASPVMITLAVTGAEAEKLIFGAENGTLWLSLDPDDSDSTGTRVVTRENVDE
jgi:pilus assembly protein CpaB